MGGFCGLPGPRRELGQSALRMAVDQAGDHVGEVGLRFYLVELAALDQGGQHRPGLPALVAAGEQSILAIQGNWADRSFYCVGV